MRLLITGITGFVGQAFCESLVLCPDFEVSGFAFPDTLADRFHERFPRIPLHRGDITSPTALHAAFAAHKPQGVLHLAGYAAVGRAHSEPLRCFHINVEGTRQVLEAARDLAPRARLVLVTSGAIYGHVPAQHGAVDETRLLAPDNPYALSKACADLLGGQYARSHGLDVVRARPFPHVGHGQGPGFVFADFAQRIVAIEHGRLDHLAHGNLEARRDFIHVRDVVAAYRLLLQHGKSGEAYNIASGRGVSIREVLEAFARHAHVHVRTVQDPKLMRPIDTPVFIGNAARLRALGWDSSFDLDAAVREVLNDWRDRPSSPSV